MHLSSTEPHPVDDARFASARRRIAIVEIATIARARNARQFARSPRPPSRLSVAFPRTSSAPCFGVLSRFLRFLAFSFVRNLLPPPRSLAARSTRVSVPSALSSFPVKFSVQFSPLPLPPPLPPRPTRHVSLCGFPFVKSTKSLVSFPGPISDRRIAFRSEWSLFCPFPL